MTIREKLSAWSNNALFAAVVGGLLVIATTALVTTYIVNKRNSDNQQLRPVEVITIGDFEQALRDAKNKVEATGYVMSRLTPDYISGKMRDIPKFTASIVVVDPLPRKVICQRQYDEDNKPRSYEQAILKLREFRQKGKNLIGERLKLGVIDAYPTMAVIIIDDALYAYFYPYKELGATGPVFKFSDYVKDERAKFFETHLRRVFQHARFLSSDTDYKPYETADLKDPCF
jgi:hypothetical protein